VHPTRSDGKNSSCVIRTRIEHLVVESLISGIGGARAALNVSPETVRAWEQGKKQPGGPAERLLQIAEKHPRLIYSVVQSRTGDDK
jgi:hypothetical protein